MGRKTDGLDFSVAWSGPAASHKFWVFEGSSKLTVHVLAQNYETGATAILCSMHTELNWTLGSSGKMAKAKRADCQNSQSWISFGYCFRPQGLPTLAQSFPQYKSKELALGSLVYYEKGPTDEKYAVVAIRSTIESPVRIDLLEATKHRAVPFINPIAFVYRPEEGLFYLVSMIPSGGNLFAHLQQERLFAEARAKTYAAELVYAVEWLHNNDLVGPLRPENIMLDCFDHICLCVPATFIAGADAAVAECPAPETQNDLTRAKEADWWVIGTFVYEILTGMPPFLPAASQDERSKMSRDLWFPPTLSITAKDLLRMLLQPDAEKRLGAKGAAEVKAHQFFKDIVWHDLPDQDPRVFRAGGCDYMLNLEPRSTKREKKLVRKISQGILYERLDWGFGPFWRDVGRVLSRESVAALYTTSPSGAWVIEWEDAQAEFRISNLSSGESALAHDEAATCGLGLPQYSFAHWTDEGDSPLPTGSSDGKPIPSRFQLKRALAMALKLRCSKQVISQVLDYGVDLNTGILRSEEIYDTYVMSMGQETIPFTPLEWAVEHNRADLVDLFLDRGADANFTAFPKRGPALVKAVLGRNTKLVDRLVEQTERSAATRGLCLAIEQEDKETVETLLAAAVCCEFEESDWPSSQPTDGCVFTDEGLLKEADFTPPLARAVRLGNSELVRLLLAHGADANVAYHHLCRAHPRQNDSGLWLPIPEYYCGRPVQLAMELGFDGIAEELIRAGADIHLPQPNLGQKRDAVTSDLHRCRVVARSVHLDVTKRLESVYRKVRSNTHPEEWPMAAMSAIRDGSV